MTLDVVMDPAAAWLATLSQFRMEMTRANFDEYVSTIQLTDFSNGVFTLSVDKPFARDWVESRLTSTVKRLLTSMLDAPIEVRFVLKADEDPRPTPCEEDASAGEEIGTADSDNLALSLSDVNGSLWREYVDLNELRSCPPTCFAGCPGLVPNFYGLSGHAVYAGIAPQSRTGWQTPDG